MSVADAAARGSGSSPTRRSASAARRARSRARSGTSSRRTASSGPARATTTPRRSARTRGGTSRSSSSTSRCGSTARRAALDAEPLRWLMSSDVCKHCTHAACLDVCPTGALFRTEFGTVVVQQDVCNGCGYCVPACPFGVIDRRHLPAPPGRRGAHAAAVRQPRGRPRLEVHALLRPAEGRPRARVREGVPDALDPVRRRSTSCASGRRRGSRSSRPTAGTARGSTATTRTTASAASARSSSSSTSPRCTGSRPTRSRRRGTCPRCG